MLIRTTVKLRSDTGQRATFSESAHQSAPLGDQLRSTNTSQIQNSKFGINPPKLKDTDLYDSSDEDFASMRYNIIPRFSKQNYKSPKRGYHPPNKYVLENQEKSQEHEGVFKNPIDVEPEMKSSLLDKFSSLKPHQSVTKETPQNKDINVVPNSPGLDG